MQEMLADMNSSAQWVAERRNRELESDILGTIDSQRYCVFVHGG